MLIGQHESKTQVEIGASQRISVDIGNILARVDAQIWSRGTIQIRRRQGVLSNQILSILRSWCRVFPFGQALVGNIPLVMQLLLWICDLFDVARHSICGAIDSV